MDETRDETLGGLGVSRRFLGWNWPSWEERGSIPRGQDETQEGTRLTKNGQGNVDEQIDAAATLEEDTDGREDDGEDDLANVAANKRTRGQLWEKTGKMTCSLRARHRMRRRGGRRGAS